eukprot:3921165-Prymnesium_polylepis.1
MFITVKPQRPSTCDHEDGEALRPLSLRVFTSTTCRLMLVAAVRSGIETRRASRSLSIEAYVSGRMCRRETSASKSCR